MAQLGAADRARLPDRAFAYVDSRGERRLPIHDAGHVRNALARFNQVRFEDDAARDRARTRLLNAAKRYGIVPVGFINQQVRSERSRAGVVPLLPSGFVTMLMSHIEGSTGLVHRLGDHYADLIGELRGVQGGCADGGCVVEARADEFFAVFEQPAAALDAAVRIQRDLAVRRWVGDSQVRVRIGIHSGYPTRAHNNYIGMAVHIAARVCAAAHGGQVVITGDAREALEGAAPAGVRLRRLGAHRLRGIPDEVFLFQLLASGLVTKFPPLRV